MAASVIFLRLLDELDANACHDDFDILRVFEPLSKRVAEENHAASVLVARLSRPC